MTRTEQLRGYLDRQAKKKAARSAVQQQRWREQHAKHAQIAAVEKAAAHAGLPLDAFRAWQRGDAIYVFNRGYEQRIINAEVNAIAQVGWKLSTTTTKLGYVVFTFTRPDA